VSWVRWKHQADQKKAAEAEPDLMEAQDSFGAVIGRMLAERGSEAPAAQAMLAKAAGTNRRLPIRGKGGRWEHDPRYDLEQP
jgi:hypothetical protein